jgi:hypothetical protein
MGSYEVQGGRLLDGLLQQRRGLGRPADQGIRRPQRRGQEGEQLRQVLGLAEGHPTFEHWDGLLQPPLLKVQGAKVETGHDEAVRIINRFSDPDSFLCDIQALAEFSALGEAPRQPSPREHGGQSREVEALL